MQRWIMGLGIAFALACLTGCGAPAATKASAAKPAGGAASAGPAAPAPGEANQLAQYRSAMLEGCIGGSRDSAPSEAPIERRCVCASDQVMQGRTYAQLEDEEASGEHATRFQSALRACIARIAQ